MSLKISWSIVLEFYLSGGEEKWIVLIIMDG